MHDFILFHKDKFVLIFILCAFCIASNQDYEAARKENVSECEIFKSKNDANLYNTFCYAEAKNQTGE